MGFVPGHFSVGRLMEASLQSVTPGVALPYWEYTIDVENIIANHNGNFFQWRNIPALSNRWFGATDEVWRRNVRDPTATRRITRIALPPPPATLPTL